jgi:hypothetical protein
LICPTCADAELFCQSAYALAGACAHHLELEGEAYANRRSKRGHRRVESRTGSAVHRELKRKHATLTC